MEHAYGSEQTCMAWYEAATSEFAAGTTIGDTIRNRIPTSYSPPPAPPAPPVPPGP